MRTAFDLAIACLFAVSCTTPGSQVVPPPAAPRAEAQLLLGDVEHLLGRAEASRKVGDTPGAQAHLREAYKVYRAQLLPRVRAVDPTVAVQSEYAFGRLLAAITDRSIERRVHQASVERALELARTALDDGEADNAPQDAAPG